MKQQSLIPSFEADGLHQVDLVAADVTDNISDEHQVIKGLANPLICSEKFLPFLAYSFKVDFWDEELKEQEKRELIQQSILLHRYKGTIWCIEEILKLLNLASDEEPANIKEGLSIKYDGKHKYNGIYTHGDETKWPFYVISLAKPVSTKRAQFAKKIIDQYAPKRSRLYAITYNQLNRYDGNIKYDGTFTYGVVGADKL
ncbi:phage tail protein I [Arcobacter sp. CECT 8985]|uniref:phage tail protein I n=1 Tax=Arcobacter sp. CECT 8985 TaxID=1935424 RepID=UPI00100BBEFF|nr:phage tail protein I [Arcobacter sp. CECT 8985]RXJ86952.1 phage tail protein I [Arcobacter sp. CECT 8985]